jgi:hypothetical protein
VTTFYTYPEATPKKVTAAYGRSERSENLRLRCCFGTGERLVECGLADLQPPGGLAHRQPRRDECPGSGELLGLVVTFVPKVTLRES